MANNDNKLEPEILIKSLKKIFGTCGKKGSRDTVTEKENDLGLT